MSYREITPEIQKSWVIVFSDGRYAYAWGDTAEEAKAAFLHAFADGILRVDPATNYGEQLPPTGYLATPRPAYRKLLQPRKGQFEQGVFLDEEMLLREATLLQSQELLRSAMPEKITTIDYNALGEAMGLTEPKKEETNE